MSKPVRKHEKATLIKRGILNVVSEIAPIPDKNMMGSIAPELVAIVTRGMDVREMMDDCDLLDQYVRTCGDIIRQGSKIDGRKCFFQKI